MAATAVSATVEPMAAPVDPYYAAQFVDDLEGSISGSAVAGSPLAEPAASRAQN
jgi:hypothetical protein